MRYKIYTLLLLMLFVTKGSFAQSKQEPSPDARPWVFWYWIKAGVSKEGITADLEAMKQAGIGGAYLMPIQGATKPPLFTPAVEQLSPLWWDMMRFSFTEAKRLGLKLGMHLSDGFALAGGPWISPELSMQKVVFSKSSLSGGKQLKMKLPQPETIAGYYQDIAVYAYPTLPGTKQHTSIQVPVITTSVKDKEKEAQALVIPGSKAGFKSNQPGWIQYAFSSPFTCRNITISTGGNNYQSHRLKVEVSDDGISFRSLGRLNAPRHGWQDADAEVTHAIEPTTAKYFRFIYDPSGSEPGAEDLDAAKWKPSFKLNGLALSAEPLIDQYESKSGAVWRVSKRATTAQLPDYTCVPKNQLIDITAQLAKDGTLNWKAPKGEWTILRIGHTSTGHTNATGGAGAGLEADKFNPVAIRTQFNHWYGEAMKQAGPALSKEVLSVFHVDSWECGSQNWSPVFREEFQRRRGYDLLPYLPVMAGVPVENMERSESVLYDIRKTIAELVADRFYDTLAGLAKEKGLSFTAESVAPTMLSDGLLHYKKVDVPMGEFWLNSPTHDKPNDMLDAISGAHIYGKNIIQAEAFTTVRMTWNEHPGMLKTLQDRNYALGINKLSYHVFAHNPWMDRKPGMTLDGVGLYFQRDQTWWKPGKAWVDYASRAQEMLQKGKPVVDLAVFIGEELPRRSVLPDRLVNTLPGIFGAERVANEKKRMANVGEPLRELPAGVWNSANIAEPQDWVNPLYGYAYDSFNTDVLLDARVSNGRVVFPSGASYAVLIFPMDNQLNPQDNLMSPEVLQKIYSLIQDGATVVLGKRPVGSFSITDAATKEKMKETVAILWNGDAADKKLGKGKVIKAPYLSADFIESGLQPDVTIVQPEKVNDIAWTHRTNNGEEIYFLSNQQPVTRELSISFRTTGKIPEFYDAVSHEFHKVKEFTDSNGRILIPLRMEAHASVFVIFKDGRQVIDKVDKGRKLNWPLYSTLAQVQGSWQVTFDPAFGGPVSPLTFDSLTDWSKHKDIAIAGYSGTAVYTKVIKWNGKSKADVWLDLGKVANLAVVKVNGKSCGTLWTAPFRLNISTALKKGDNLIEIAVTNTWANRLIADQALPEAQRITNTTAPFRLKDKPFEEAGLLGPVKLIEEEL